MDAISESITELALFFIGSKRRTREEVAVVEASHHLKLLPFENHSVGIAPWVVLESTERAP